MQPYHDTEIALQDRTGRRSLAEALAPRIAAEMMPETFEFLPGLPFVVACSLDEGGRPWASILSGPAGFMRPAPHALRIEATPDRSDPLRGSAERGGDIGLIAIDFTQRRRFRVNGRATLDAGGITVAVAQCYRNCPQYINGRVAAFDPACAASLPTQRRWMDALDDRALSLVRRADTFFIASHGTGGKADDPRLGADVSHRGGNPGFVAVDDSRRRISFPDYVGNFMFNTLGNLTRYPRCGLLFIDFETGSTLQVTGRSTIDWALERAVPVPGAQRLIDVDIEEAIWRDAAVPVTWGRLDPARDLRRFQAPAAAPADHATPAETETAAGFESLVVASIVDEAEHIRSFILRSPSGALLDPVVPGQHIPVRLTVAGRPVTRHYSISNHDPGRREYRIGVRRVQGTSGGLGSGFLHDGVQIGSRLLVGRPQGRFTVDLTGERPVALISAGVGITPMLAMLLALDAGGSQRPICFIHGTRNSADQAYASEVRRLSDRKPNITAHIRYSQPRPIDVQGRDHDSTGRIDLDLVTTLVPKDADIYLCGPDDFMARLRSGLVEWGIARERIHIEAFGAAVEVAASLGQDGARVSFASHGAAAIWTTGSGSLLDLAEAAGLSLPYGCRLGTCGTCEQRLLDGDVVYTRRPEVTARPGYVLTCCSQPLCDLVIEDGG